MKIDGGRQMKILIVDDDSNARKMLNYTLTRRGYRVEEAGNGREALEKIAEDKPDIILLDAMMPIMDGFKTCRRLRANPDTRNIPIIFCTGTHIDKVKEGKIKVDDYMEKPLSIDKLCKKIDKILEL
jgi:DNA-binding response OmpR family regulator